MNLWKVSQTITTGYEEFDSAVIAAESEDDARLIHPSKPNGVLKRQWDGTGWRYNFGVIGAYDHADWAAPRDLHVELLGEAADGTPPGVIGASRQPDRRAEDPWDFFLRTSGQSERIGLPMSQEEVELRRSHEAIYKRAAEIMRERNEREGLSE